jgi:hypothetical protein
MQYVCTCKYIHSMLCIETVCSVLKQYMHIKYIHIIYIQ